MIIPVCPKLDESGRYTVTETCRILGIHRNSLRKYTDSGYIRPSYNTLSCRKLYEGREIVRFWRSMM